MKVFRWSAAALVPAAAAGTLAVSGLAGANGPTSVAGPSPVPRWVLHIRSYPGGISNGVREALAAGDAATRAPAGEAPLAAAPTAVASGNVQMNDNSYPPMPQNETSVALSTADENIAVAASNDYVDGGVTVMRTSDGGHSWRTVRVVPVYRHPGDPCPGTHARAVIPRLHTAPGTTCSS